MMPSRFKQRLVRSTGFLTLTRGLNCLSCSSPPPVHAHHIRYAEEHGIGRKVGDNWTVPLCWVCHTELHNCPLGEQLWWADKGIDPLEEAKINWEKFNE